MPLAHQQCLPDPPLSMMPSQSRSPKGSVLPMMASYLGLVQPLHPPGFAETMEHRLVSLLTPLGRLGNDDAAGIVRQRVSSH